MLAVEPDASDAVGLPGRCIMIFAQVGPTRS